MLWLTQDGSKEPAAKFESSARSWCWKKQGWSRQYGITMDATAHDLMWARVVIATGMMQSNPMLWSIASSFLTITMTHRPYGGKKAERRGRVFYQKRYQLSCWAGESWL